MPDIIEVLNVGVGLSEPLGYLPVSVGDHRANCKSLSLKMSQGALQPSFLHMIATTTFIALKQQKTDTYM